MSELTTTLTHKDIIKIAADLNNKLTGERANEFHLDQFYLEYLLCCSIKERKSVDFMREELAQEINKGMQQEATQDMLLNPKL